MTFDPISILSGGISQVDSRGLTAFCSGRIQEFHVFSAPPAAAAFAKFLILHC